MKDLHFKAGKDITKFLIGMEQAAIFVCTAGEEVSKRSTQLTQQGDLIEGYLIDILGSLIVEKAMDKIQENLKIDMLNRGLKITNRYSPGYCQWSVNEQQQLFSFLPNNFCQISLGDSCLMKPIKSVSGIIGIGKNSKYHEHVCHNCNSISCLYRDHS